MFTIRFWYVLTLTRFLGSVSRFLEVSKFVLREHPLWRELNLERLYDKRDEEHLTLLPIVTRIRKAKAKTMFGVGVKLVAAKYYEEYDFIEAMIDALRQIGVATGTNFLADAGDNLIETGNTVGKGDIEISANLHPVRS